VSIPIVDNRFILDDPQTPRVGGTAHVYRAQDHKNGGAVVAIKLFDGAAIDDDLRLECFRRERAALGALSHPHVVRLLGAGHDDKRGQHYLALEWLDEDLPAFLGQNGKTTISWPTVAHSVLHPLLDGLVAAQSRRIAHRDIKPQNIMVNSKGTIKLTDFGISKLIDSMRMGMTVRELHSRPYTPPEYDSGELDARSDLYSLGVTAVDLLNGLTTRLPRDADPQAILADLEIPDDGRYFLQSLIAIEPENRPFSPKLALTELERLLVWHKQTGKTQHRNQLRVGLTKAVLSQAQELLGTQSENETRKLVIQDLSDEKELPTLAPNRKADYTWADESSVPLDLSGTELAYSAWFDKDGTGSLVLTAANLLPPSVHARRRDRSMELEHQLMFAGRVTNQRESADLLIEALVSLSDEQAEANRRRSEAELFERWRAVLDAKTELESRREDPLAYNGTHRDRSVVSFTVKSEVDERYLDQTRRVPIPSVGAVVGTVVEVGTETIGLAVERGPVDALPIKGQLLADRNASRRAIDRQMQALNAIRDGEGARADLGELLVNPRRVGPLAPVTVESFFQILDKPKQHAVEVALSSPDFTLVQGPPGTGKTTFIAELITQLLAGRPEARVLLSSQTHVAVDNAALKLSELSDLRIVRVGPDEKIDDAAAHLTVREQLRSWQSDARRNAEEWLESWGQTRGISRKALRAYGTAAELSGSEKGVRRVQTRLNELSNEEDRLLELLTDPARPPRSTVSTGEMVADEEDELAAVQDEIEARRQELGHLEQELDQHRATFSEQVETSELLDPTARDALLSERFAVASDDLDHYLSLVKLQDEWLVRFGQGEEFTESLLATAQVVAGTCVGLAGRIDDQDPFDLAIVDEASKATPTEALVPLARSRHWVLVGDEQQLPPYIDSGLIDEGLLEGHGLERWDLEETLFAQLESALPEDRSVRLTEQHRMLSPIGDLISHCFYDKSLTSSRPARSEDTCLEAVFSDPVTWYSTARLSGRREQKLGTTYWNESEVRIVRRLIHELQRSAAAHDRSLEVAVISGYGEQARRIQRNLRPGDSKWSHLNIHVHPIDSFQGQERDVVLYSVTRSNAEYELGFLRSERRINVALSRAKDALVIIGDHRFCARARQGDNPFARVLNHIQKFEGCHLEVPSR
jgi:serine/threonine protein kinase